MGHRRQNPHSHESSRKRGHLNSNFILLIAVLVVGALEAPRPAAATALSAFHTPSWLVQCYVVGEEHPPVLRCSRPRDGFFVSMTASGRVQIGRNLRDKGYHDPFAALRVLNFGQYWKFDSLFECVSRSGGVKCWNKSGHGWLLGRPDGYRLF
jgi:hypothetical protein